jgi:hypothetical protein
MYMDTHLHTMMQQIDSMSQGIFVGALPEKYRTRWQKYARNERHFLEKYVLLHDIAKKDCLTIKCAEEETMTWQEWNRYIPPTLQKQPDPEALQVFLQQKNVISISYFQKGPKHGARTHGKVGVDFVKRSHRGSMTPLLAHAIEHHEVGYLFSTVAPATYEKYFSALSVKERDMVLCAAYLDTTASFGKDYQPQLNNFTYLLQSAEWFAATQDLKNDEEIHLLLHDKKIDPLKVRQFFDRPNLAMLSARIPSKKEFIESVLPTEYQVEALMQDIQSLQAGGLLAQDDVEIIRELAANRRMFDLGPILGKKLGKNMIAVREVIARHEIKTMVG